MRNTFNFIKKTLGNRIEILDRYDEVGFVKFNNFKTDVTGGFRSKNYLFKKKSFLSTSYNIFREDNEQLIGEVVFSGWKKKAEMTLVNGEKFTLSTTNFWGTKWKIDDVNREVLDFEQTKQFWSNEGVINTNVNDEEKMGLLVLLGVFVNFVYARRAAAAEG